MKELFIALPKKRLPKYQRLAEGIRTSIKTGMLKPGEILPSTRELAKRFRFDRHTIMKALGELESEGWIQSKEKVNYQVVNTLPTKFLQPLSNIQKQFAPKEVPLKFARSLQDVPFHKTRTHRFSFPSGAPDPRLFPIQEFKSHLYDALSSRDLLVYGSPEGQARLIEQIKIFLRRVRNIQDRKIVVTNGSQEAIFYLAQLLLRPGDCVAVEELGYPATFEALRFAGAELYPIRVDSEGLVIEDFERLLKKRKVRMIAVTPLHQYPTTVTLSASRRLRLYELAYRHDVFILEDDYDHEFHYESQPVAPLASFDPAGLVLYVSTFSKVLFPTARTGFMAVPEKIGLEAQKLKRISSRQNEPLMQETIAKWMESGGLERHLRRMRRAYAERLDRLIQDLEVYKMHHDISWHKPDGGMALWLNIGVNSHSFANKALDKVMLNPENIYRLDDKIGTHLRLGFSGQTVSENSAGLEALFSALKSFKN